MGGHETFSPGSPGHDSGGGTTHSASPWDGGSSGGDRGGGHLSQDAGLGDIGGSGRRAAYDDKDNKSDSGGSFLGGSADELSGDQPDNDDDFDTGDFDGGDGGDSDTE
jgi:hypothetical protein